MLTDSPHQAPESTVWRYFCNFLLSSQTSKQNNEQDRHLQSAGNNFFWARKLSLSPSPKADQRLSLPLRRKAASRQL